LEKEDGVEVHKVTSLILAGSVIILIYIGIVGIECIGATLNIDFTEEEQIQSILDKLKTKIDEDSDKFSKPTKKVQKALSNSKIKKK